MSAATVAAFCIEAGLTVDSANDSPDPEIENGVVALGGDLSAVCLNVDTYGFGGGGYAFDVSREEQENGHTVFRSGPAHELNAANVYRVALMLKEGTYFNDN
jgi:hypothetical protein